MRWLNKNKNITYSRNIFIPLTNVCRNNCDYCSFKKDVTSPYAFLMKMNDIIDIFKRCKYYHIKEVLLTFGEYAEHNSIYKEWLNNIGYNSTIDYAYDVSLEAIKYGLLPHTNAGLLSYNELKKLSKVNASMGLMLESINSNLNVHKNSPGKDPKKRLKLIENAGKLKIPFTTGILIGIEDSNEDIILSLKKIAQLQKKYHHIQEVIIQNYSKGEKKNTNIKEPTTEKMIQVIIQAKKILPNDISIQIAPNLIDIKKLLKYNINDIGGISPLTIDYINPSNKWPEISSLKKIIFENGYILKERLTIYPKYIYKHWYSNLLKKNILILNQSIMKRNFY